MPDQAFSSEREGDGPGWRVLVARISLLALVAGSTALFARTLYQVLSVNDPTVLQWVFLLLCTLCFGWVSIGSASAVLGFISLALTDAPDDPPVHASGERLALLFPVYREDPRNICITIDVMSADLRNSAGDLNFDIFILSDTQDPNEREIEEQAYAGLRASVASRVAIFVRWRTPNVGKKAGNIREWIETQGGAYPYFIVMDADSLMTGESVRTLVATMQNKPRAGLIQTVPTLVGGTTLFAHLQQFAAGYYGPVLTAGLALWHGSNANYWGHNAIVRTAAFAASAGLPQIKGRPPFGGHILSHDFVEAALLRRAGWEVWMLPRLPGSYEGCPPTLTDLVVRDRRWAQGNMQHLGIVGASGLTFLSRLHLLLGAWAYLASAVWAATLLVGVVLAVQGQYALPVYFTQEETLFPKWPVFDAQKAFLLFFVTLAIVHIPKILGVVWALRTSAERRRNGGALRVVFGALVESIAATLVAPILMITQTSAVAGILAGRDSGWSAQSRTGAHVPMRAYFKQYRWHLFWGIVGLIVCGLTSTAVLAWMSPILLGLLLAAPVARISAATPSPIFARALSAQPMVPLLATLAHTRQMWQMREKAD